MAFTELTKEEFLTHIRSVQYKSFMQSEEMATLFRKRGYEVSYVGLKVEKDIKVSALVYMMPMTGGLHMEINSGPVSSDTRFLSEFYKGLTSYAKEKGALELIVKPFDTYQTFDSDGKPTSKPKKELIEILTNLGYHHDGLLTGYPGGEPDWHYVKDLKTITSDHLLQSFSKKGKPLVKKAKTFGITLKKLKRDELSIFKDITASTSEKYGNVDKPLDYYEDFFDSFKDKAEFMIATLNFNTYLQHLNQDQEKLKQKVEQLQQRFEKTPSTKTQNQLSELQQQIETFDIRKKEAQQFITEYGDQEVVLAGSLFIYTKQEAVYLFSGSYVAFNKFYAPALLQEYVMLEAIKKQIPLYNFLGITGDFAHEDGILRFKQNFNGYITRKMGTFRYYPSPFKFRLLQGIKKILGR
ncbi:aminoacyltransferase [Streptococcus sp. CSL10205-OR2]|uniref:aminoacyltransferase n=1 Tax=Streptococcus sp. CSL10205-OR2 TaxID=2980558 RepID=UPI0021DACD50|nr:aminoacyltransferase [Streptococcus sp. CSL10205-OR2]MCU9534300.1 aminoacyltransferase [Streptococcus sp. CSL10205-OR2]